MEEQETFDKLEIETAISQFIAYGERESGKSHSGYFSGDGFAARALRYHLKQLQNEETNTTETTP